jgi:hypothetical protein
MLVFDFDAVNEDALDPVLARAIWFSESGISRPNQTFRIVLLGFLIRALRRYNIVPCDSMTLSHSPGLHGACGGTVQQD